MLLNRVQTWSRQQAETNAGFFVIKQVHMGDPEFVRRGFAKFPEVVFGKRDLVDVEEYGQRNLSTIYELIFVFRTF
jgi:hypothetical protein